jgi:hypothetical protein
MQGGTRLAPQQLARLHRRRCRGSWRTNPGQCARGGGAAVLVQARSRRNACSVCAESVRGGLYFRRWGRGFGPPPPGMGIYFRRGRGFGQDRNANDPADPPAHAMALQHVARRALGQLLGAQGACGFAAKATGAAVPAVVAKKDWKAVELPEKTASSIPLTRAGGQAFGNDLRGTSGLGLGDGIKTHTDKWLMVCRWDAWCSGGHVACRSGARGHQGVADGETVGPRRGHACAAHPCVRGPPLHGPPGVGSPPHPTPAPPSQTGAAHDGARAGQPEDPHGVDQGGPAHQGLRPGRGLVRK